MSKFTDFFQDKVMNALVSFAENPNMQAIRNGMMLTIPFTIIGSVFTIIRSFPIPALANFVEPYGNMLDVGYSITFGMMAIIVSITVAYNMSQQLKVNPLNTAIVSLISFLTLQVQLVDGGEGAYFVSTDNFGSTGIFTAMLVGLLVPYIMRFFENRQFVIKLPGGVPSYVSDSFITLIPAFFTILLMWVVRVLLAFDVNQLVGTIISPLIVGLNTLPGILLFTFIVMILWSCGLNGDSILSGIFYPIVLSYMAVNSQAFIAGQPIPYITADGFYYFGMWLGGTGGTFGLVLLMMRSKSKTYKALSKICLPTGIFCINEPLVFGFPLMFNPVMMIPYVMTPIILLTATYFLMQFNVIGRPVVSIPWTTPPLLNAFLATGGDFRAVIWQFIEIIISMCIYFPFFRVSEKAKLKEEALEENAAV